MTAAPKVTISLAQAGEPLWAVAERFQYQVYVALGYAEENPEKRILGFDRWNDSAAFHVARREDEVVGVMRTIVGEVQTLPTGMLRGLSADRVASPAVEFGSLAVQHPGDEEPVRELFASATGWGVQRGAQSILALVDDWLFRSLKDRHGIPFQAIGAPRPYMGGAPFPVTVTMAVLPTVVGRNNPALWAATEKACGDVQIEPGEAAAAA